MMDLQEDRSLIRGLLAAGVDVYLIDWGYPDGADRFTTLADYIDGYLARLRRADPADASTGCPQYPRRLSGRGVQPVLLRAASAAGAQSGHHGHAGGLSYPGGSAVEMGEKNRRAGLGGRGQCFGRRAESAVPVAHAVSPDAAKIRASAGGRIGSRRASRTSCGSSNGSSTVRTRPAPHFGSSWCGSIRRIAWCTTRLKSPGARSICAPCGCRY